jgi:putative membrane protein
VADQEKSTSPKDTTTLKESPFLALKGFLMGSADIVPGVSGGTMALIVGIYERLLNAIKSVNGNFIKLFFSLKWKDAFKEVHFFFLLVLFAGIFSALAFFTKVVPLQIYMFTHPEIVYGLFFGLIVGSIYILIKALERFTKVELLMLFVGIAFGIWIVSLVPADTPEHPAFVFLSGSIAICAMILPGISGSYLLLIMRKYDYLLSQIGKIGGLETVDGLLGLLPFMLGAIVGLAIFSRFLSWLLSKYHPQTIAVLIGFLIGSLYVIWPYQHREFVEQVRETEVVYLTDPKAQELMEDPQSTNLPEYQRLGEISNAESTFDEMKQVEIETVKNKLIKSEPYIPGWLGSKADDNPNVWGGVIGILIGMIMVGGLDRLRDK